MPELRDLRKDPGLGPLLKELRGRLGLSHKHVAAAVWGDEGKWNWYSKLENRPNAYPSEADLDRILEVLGSSRVEAETLLGRRTWSDPVAGPPMAAMSAPAAAPPAPEPMRSSPFRRSADLESARPPATGAPQGLRSRLSRHVAPQEPATRASPAAASPAAASPAAASPAAASPAGAPLAAASPAGAPLTAAPPAGAPLAAAPPATTARDLALRGEGLRLLSEMDGADLVQGVRQLRSLRARSKR